MIEAIFYGHEAIQPMLDMQERLKAEVGKPKREIPQPDVDEALETRIKEIAAPLLGEVIVTADKMQRQQKRKEAENHTMDLLSTEYEGKESEIKEAVHSLEKAMVRQMMLSEGKRIDGRAFDEVRPIECLVGLLPRIHGSALFTRGETQAMALTTLGTERDEQRIESIYGEHFRSFILHYNFPPYSVGEAKRLGGPGRREIGHGALARRALLPVLPDSEDFQYCIRVVSEILESNGSSSMATVCGGCLSLMDAGVPIKEPVAGVAMGLVTEGDKVAVLTDILGDEDHYGDMDFKVTGTRDGITALQMDIKIERLTKEIMQQALEQARAGRLFILDEMAKAITRPRADVSEYAPIITSVQINSEKVRILIGPGGKTIREISNSSGARIDVDDEGIVTVSSPDKECSESAIKMIKAITQEAEVGKLYMGKVVKIMDFGAFVEIFPGTDGLIHISQLAEERVNKVTDVLNEGDEVLVKVLEVGNDGRIRLSRKAALGESLDRVS
jgi:polyribonucleotide nucleotidyltransferase